MALLKTQVNIILNWHGRRAGLPADRRTSGGRGCAPSRKEIVRSHGREKRKHCVTIGVAINSETTTFREPFGRSPDAKSGPGRSAAWLAHLTGGQGVGGSNPPAPTTFFGQARGAGYAAIVIARSFAQVCHRRPNSNYIRPV